MTNEVDQSVSNAPDEAVSNSTQATDQFKKETVDPATFRKLVGQKKAFQEEANATKAELARVNAELEAHNEAIRKSNEEKAKADGNWELLLEQSKAENARLQAERDAYKSDKEQSETILDHAVKLDAVKSMLPGKLLNPAYANFIDVEKIAVNPDTGELDMDSVNSVAQAFATQHKNLMDLNKFKGLPGDSANTGFTDPVKRFRESPLTDMRKNAAAAVRARLKKA